MPSDLPITGAFNDAYIEGLYEAWRREPASVDASWQQLFQLASHLAAAAQGAQAPGAPAVPDPALLRAAAGAAALARAIRQFGHLAAQLDPLGAPPSGAPELAPEFHGIAEGDLERLPGSVLGFAAGESAAQGVARLRALYTGSTGYEFEHLETEEERAWFRHAVEGPNAAPPLSAEERVAVLRRLTEVDGLERYLGRAFGTAKRFSIEGTDALVPMLDAAVEWAGGAGAREVVIGMAHRGRINVLAHILSKPAEAVLAEFEGQHPEGNAESGTGDVKYHLGAVTERTLPQGGTLRVRLMPNPSHLELVDPVLEGAARALQRVPGAAPGARDASRALPILVHGDAAFPGEGVVAETFNLAGLAGYTTGGTLHIITNNQVGFTTDPHEGRFTRYASDLARGFGVPVVHVNGDDAAACVAAVRLGLAYRARFGKDVLVDLVGYRRQGHNEMDEPAFTQPRLYAAIRSHPTPREVWGARLVAEGVVREEEVRAIDAEVRSRLEAAHARVKGAGGAAEGEERAAGAVRAPAPAVAVETAVPAERLTAVNEQLLAWPGELRVNPKLARVLERRRPALQAPGGVDWGHAEALAWGSLLVEGISVRVTGQDVERGTFSHRQAVLHDQETGTTYTPLQHLSGAAGAFEIVNSPLSETAVLGFEYGYSVAAPDALVQWEAQFGDFANVAQPVMDQFIAAGRAKWGQDSSVVLLLPHGYEGQGPEHSSARLERFLQLAAEGNVRVAYPSTPAQYFHILRRQALWAERRPLVLMQPKSLLRLPAAGSSLTDLTAGRFAPVLDDARMGQGAARGAVRRVVFCTGKLYYELLAAEPGAQVALVRVEELYPWPHDEVARVLDGYAAVEDVVWAQEEPRNMGAWTFVAPRLRAAAGAAMPVRYVGRPERASPAEGHAGVHQAQQAALVAEALAPLPERVHEAARGEPARV